MQSQLTPTPDTLNSTQILHAYFCNMGSLNNAENRVIQLDSFIENISSSRADSPTPKTSKLDKLKTALTAIKTDNTSWGQKRANKFENDSAESIKREIKKSLKIYQQYFLTKFSSDGNPDNCDPDIKDRISNFKDDSELLKSIDASDNKDSLITLGVFLNNFLLGLTIASESTISEDKKSTEQSEEIDKIKTNLLIFPGGTSFKEKIVFACIDGSTARVQDGIFALHDSSIESRFVKEYFNVSTAILASKVQAGSQVHTQSCLIGALMDDRSMIAKIDKHFTSPQRDIALIDVIKFSHDFAREIEQKLSHQKKELIEAHSELLENFEANQLIAIKSFLDKTKSLGFEIDPDSLTKDNYLTLISVDEFTERHLKFPTEKFKKELSKVPEALTIELDYLKHLPEPKDLFKTTGTESGGEEIAKNRLDVKKISTLINLILGDETTDKTKPNDHKGKLLAGLVTLRNILDNFETSDDRCLYFYRFNELFKDKTGSSFKDFFFDKVNEDLVVKKEFKQEESILKVINSRSEFWSKNFIKDLNDSDFNNFKSLMENLFFLSKDTSPNKNDNFETLILTPENEKIKNGYGSNLLNILYQFDEEYFKLAIAKKPEFIDQIAERNNNGLSLINILAQKGDNELLLYVLEEYKKHKGSKALIELINDQKLLFDIVKTNNLEILEKVIEMAGKENDSQVKIDFTQQDSSGATILHLACQKGYLDLAQALIEQYKIDLNLTHLNGATPLYLACQNGHTKIVEALLAKDGINLDLARADGTTPLFIACQNGHTKIVEALLAKDGINLDLAIADGTTPLFIACQNGHTQIVKALIAKDEIGLNQAREEGITPLYVACFQGHLDIVKALIAEEKIDLNLAKEDGKTPLYVACSQGKVDIVKALIKEKKIDLDLSAKDGTSPLLIACRRGHCEIVEALFDAGANIDLLQKRDWIKILLNHFGLSSQSSNENSFTPQMNELINRITCPNSIKTRNENLEKKAISERQIAFNKNNIELFNPIDSRGLGIIPNSESEITQEGITESPQSQYNKNFKKDLANSLLFLKFVASEFSSQNKSILNQDQRMEEMLKIYLQENNNENNLKKESIAGIMINIIKNKDGLKDYINKLSSEQIIKLSIEISDQIILSPNRTTTADDLKKGLEKFVSNPNRDITHATGEPMISKTHCNFPIQQ